MKLYILVTVLVSCLPKCLSIPVPEVPPRVDLANGTVQGFWGTSATGKHIRNFLGIPFAAPPLADRRFKPPEGALPWTGVLNATTMSLPCVQRKIPIYGKHPYLRLFFGAENGITEDCLKLNVFAPQDLSVKKAVMLFIYGGGFARGGADNEVFDGTQLSGEEDVIVVTINYRVAVMGFLYLDHKDAPGNVGLMDQVMALKWVHENIAQFGGDPDQVTIFGQSAGSASVGYHLILQESKDLFRRAILESGSPTAFFAYERREVLMDYGKQLLQNIGCPYKLDTAESKLAAIECLQKADYNDINDNEPRQGYDYVYIFKPVVDGTFIKDHPLALLRDGKSLKKAEIMIGTVRDEGSMFLTNYHPAYFPLTEKVRSTKDIFSDTLHVDFGLDEVTVDVIMGLYFYDDHKDVTRAGVEIMNDAFFTCPIQDMERAMESVGGTVYKFKFLYRTHGMLMPKWIGIHHGAELIYVFGHALRADYNYTDSEKKFSKSIMRKWANFAKTGDPNSIEDLNPPFHGRWPKYTRTHEEYLVLAPNSTAVGRHMRAKYCVFWNDIIPKLINQHTTKQRGVMEFFRSGY